MQYSWEHFGTKLLAHLYSVLALYQAFKLYILRRRISYFLIQLIDIYFELQNNTWWQY